MKLGTLAWLLAAALVAGGAFLGGRALRGGEDQTIAFALEGPAFEAAGLLSGRSHGGFSGFADTGGIDGRVLLAGRVLAIQGDSIMLSANGRTTTVRLTGERSLLRIAPADVGAVRPGVTVAVLRKPGSDEAASVLVFVQP